MFHTPRAITRLIYIVSVGHDSPQLALQNCSGAARCLGAWASTAGLERWGQGEEAERQPGMFINAKARSRGACALLASPLVRCDRGNPYQPSWART